MRHRRIIRDTGQWAAPEYSSAADDPDYGARHELGNPVDLVAAPPLGPDSAYVAHLHPLYGWVREFMIDGSRATVFP